MSSPTATPRAIYFCAFLLAGSVLQLEIALTRIFSVLTWYHFTYMIISIALLGFGVAGSYLTLRRSRGSFELTPRRLSNYAYLYAVSAIASVLLVTQTSFYLSRDWLQVVALGLWYLLLIVPFLFAGLCQGSLWAIYSADINRVYAADLLGAGLGALTSVLAIQYLGATNTIVLVALLAAITGWLLRTLEPGSRRAPGLVLAGLLAVLLVAGLIFDPFLVYSAPYKDIAPLVSPDKGPAALDVSRWSVIARIDITEPIVDDLPSFGGDISPAALREWEHRAIFQDGAAPIGILHADGDLAGLDFLDNYLQAVPYQIAPRPRVLMIGVGGGWTC